MGYYDIENREVKLSEDELNKHITDIKTTIGYFIIIKNKMNNKSFKEILIDIEYFKETLIHNFYLVNINKSFNEIENIIMLNKSESENSYFYCVAYDLIFNILDYYKDELSFNLKKKQQQLKLLRKDNKKNKNIE